MRPTDAAGFRGAWDIRERLWEQTEPVMEPGYPESMNFALRRCLRAILNEEWELRLCAERDFCVLESGSSCGWTQPFGRARSIRSVDDRGSTLIAQLAQASDPRLGNAAPRRSVTMRAPTTRVSRTLMLASTPVAVLLAGLMVWQGTNAAFSAQTQNGNNTWGTGSVSISNNSNGTAMFTLPRVVPGQSGRNCILVTATPNVPGKVRTYVQGLQDGGLANYVSVTMEKGTGNGLFGDCTGFSADEQATASKTLTEAAAGYNSYANGVLEWIVPAGTSTEMYQISWTFDTSALTQAQVDGLQGQGAIVNIVWELQNS